MTAVVAIPVLPEAPPYSLRAMTDADRPFIFSTWLRWTRQSGKWLRLLRDRTFWNARDGYRAHVDWLMARSKVLVACESETPEFIIGYVVVGPTGAVHMVYVDSSFRKHGVALDLLRSVVSGFGERETICTMNRPAWSVFATKFKLRFDPFAEGLAGERFKEWAAQWRESCSEVK